VADREGVRPEMTLHPRQMSTRATRADLLLLINGFQASQAIHVAAALGLADLMSCSPKSAADLANATKTQPGALYRLMRALASIGLFQEDYDARFVLTPLGEFLRTDVAGTLAPRAQLIGRPSFWQSWGELLSTVTTGATAFDRIYGRNYWDHRSISLEEARIFDQTMATATEWFADSIIDACRFDRFEQVVDVGGGDGTFLAKILTNHPQIRGTLFDQPDVARRAITSPKIEEISNRCEVIGGNFFADMPPGGDAYLLKWILHDWDDVASINILRSCRKTIKPAGRLLVVEYVIGPPNAFPEGKFMDLNMLAMTGGRERTCEEFASIFAEAGFRLLSVSETATEFSVLEGLPEAI
jgi:SAM-dependent methyltransferase